VPKAEVLEAEKKHKAKRKKVSRSSLEVSGG
jgi:hypothetical protein